MNWVAYLKEPACSFLSPCSASLHVGLIKSNLKNTYLLHQHFCLNPSFSSFFFLYKRFNQKIGSVLLHYMTKQLISRSITPSTSLDKATVFIKPSLLIYTSTLSLFATLHYKCMLWLHTWYPRLVFVPKPQISPKAENCMKILPPKIKNFGHTSWSTKPERNKTKQIKTK